MDEDEVSFTVAFTSPLLLERYLKEEQNTAGGFSNGLCCCKWLLIDYRVLFIKYCVVSGSLYVLTLMAEKCNYNSKKLRIIIVKPFILLT